MSKEEQSLVPKDLFEGFPKFFRDFSEAFDKAFSGMREYMNQRGIKVNYEETDEAYKLGVPLEGYEKKDISLIPVSGGLELIAERETEEGNHKLQGFWQYPGMDLGAVDASFKDGYLNITVPKTEELRKKVRPIEIK
jgi:HSP20 family protein